LRNALLWLLRIGAYLFHLLLALFLIGLGIAAASNGPANLKLDMLPWQGVTLAHVVLILGFLGIVCVLAAMMGKFRWLFPLWALFVLVMMFRGFFLSGYSFADKGQFHFAVWLTSGAFLAFLVSLSLLGRKRAGY
jgi:hypothetical protein